MMRNTFIICFLISFIFWGGCIQQPGKVNREEGWMSFHPDTLRKVIAVLAADSMEGRKPLTPGETRTVRYLQKKFAESGLEPGNGNSYLQEVPLVNITTMADPSMKVASSKGEFMLKAADDYVIWTNKTEAEIELKDAEVIFAGYGIVAPEYGWNDYEGLDVRDKVVLVMVNDPGFLEGDTTLFKGKTMTFYGRWTYKFEEAARQGARGCLIIHNTAAASYSFAVPSNNFNTARLLPDNRNKSAANCDVLGWVTEATGIKLLREAGQDTTLLRAAGRRGFTPVPLGLKLSTNLKVQAEYGSSFNVAGKITGTKYPDEVIIFTGHWDHLGIGKPDETGDSIYNGAVDNATAVAGLTELARAFNSLKAKPERTILFLAVTAEEQGLLGSSHFVENPLFPLSNIVANINLECLNFSTPTKDLIIIGAGNTDLEEILAEELHLGGGYVSAETHPEAGSFFRSDHFPFFRAGVPALYAVTGIDVVGKGKEYGKKIVDDYQKNQYHRPCDEFNESTWTMEGAIFELRILFQVGKRLAFGQRWPQWKPESEYKPQRKDDI